MPLTHDSHVFDSLATASPGARKVLAEGDSWFAYPRKFLAFGPPDNIVQWLKRNRKDLVIYSTASNGDEMLSMISSDEKFALLKRLAANAYDYLLFSGGGNDIVGRYDFDVFIRRKSGGMAWRDCIREDRLRDKISQLMLAYEELAWRVADLAPATKIVTHTYDFAIPSAAGFELFDLVPLGRSWMHPFLMEKDISDPDDQRAIVRHIMTTFGDALIATSAAINARDPGRMHVVPTQGTLADDEWQNEIHPTSEGFGKIARRISAAIPA